LDEIGSEINNHILSCFPGIKNTERVIRQCIRLCKMLNLIRWHRYALSECPLKGRVVTTSQHLIYVSVTRTFNLCTLYVLQGAVTHSTRQRVKTVNFEWEPPISLSGNISFFATVVKDTATFWVKLRSPELYKRVSAIYIRGTMGQGLIIAFLKCNYVVHLSAVETVLVLESLRFTTRRENTL
jgi:hypothetical protein